MLFTDFSCRCRNVGFGSAYFKITVWHASCRRGDQKPCSLYLPAWYPPDNHRYAAGNGTDYYSYVEYAAQRVGQSLAAALNIFFLIRSGITFKVYALGKILLAAVLMAAVSMLLYNYLIVYWGNTFATAVTIFAAGIVYLLTLIASGTIGRKELQKLPVIGSRFK